MIIKTTSYPRAALVGNPSDGYFGKTIAFVFSNFRAEVFLYESPEIEIVPSVYDSLVYSNIHKLNADVKAYGYYGGIRLIKATIKVFYNYCLTNNIQLPEKNFTVRYHSDIPYGLGLAGSSAIITACMKALMNFYEVFISKPILANLVLSVENDELKIAAGLQDRVAQAYECPVYMDFNKKYMEEQGYGKYEPFDPALLPDLYIAYRTDLSEGSELVHNTFRERYHAGDPQVLDAIKQWSELTEKAYELLLRGQKSHLGQLLNQNFDLRRKVMSISKDNILMVELARSVGAAAKFTGSGGAIIGTYEGDSMFHQVVETMAPYRIQVIKPENVYNI